MGELLVIGGPTASGKTKAAIALANYLKCPILSADSRQFFREMSIGTAKPDADELAQATHYFINNKSIEEDYSAGDFEREAIALLETLFVDHPYVVLVGGSGLYIDAVCKGMDELPKSAELRENLNGIYQREGLEVLQEELKEKDPDYYASCDNQNPVRVIRALELIRLTEKKMAAIFAQNAVQRNFTTRLIVLDVPRKELYERINRRVDVMIDQGLLHEAMQLVPYKHKNALQTVGYKELFDYFDGDLDLDGAVDLIKQNSRRYAKRQITWFKRYPEAVWVRPEAFEDMEVLVEQMGLDND